MKRIVILLLVIIAPHWIFPMSGASKSILYDHVQAVVSSPAPRYYLNPESLEKMSDKQISADEKLELLTGVQTRETEVVPLLADSLKILS